MFWCCTNTDDDDDTTLPQLHTSEQVLPFSKELTKELKTLERSQTAAKLAKKPSPHFFTIRLDRAPGTSFGLDVSAVGRVCMVNDVHPDSLVGEWNQQCFEAGDLDQAVQQYDRLMALNHERPERGRQVMERLQAAEGSVSIVIQRPVIRRVKVKRNGLKDLGIAIIDGHGFLVISSISEGGVFAKHNATAIAEDAIPVPSRIISVDGEYGHGFELMQIMEESGEVFVVDTLRFG